MPSEQKRTMKQLRREEAAEAMVQLIPPKGAMALIYAPQDRINYLREKKNLKATDKLALMLSDGNDYTGTQLERACGTWVWNQRKNYELLIHGFTTIDCTDTLDKDVPVNEHHYIASGDNSAGNMCRRYFDCVYDQMSGRIMVSGRKLVENPQHPDNKITKAQITTIHIIKNKLNLDDETYRDVLSMLTDCESCTDPKMTKSKASYFIDDMYNHYPWLKPATPQKIYPRGDGTKGIEV